jgi:hypothetical protein
LEYGFKLVEKQTTKKTSIQENSKIKTKVNAEKGVNKNEIADFIAKYEGYRACAYFD